MKELDIVCGAIQTADKFLIARRSKGADPGFWEFPGGKVEKGESREQALLRELKEELSLNVRILEYLCSVDDIRENLILHVHAFRCEIIEGTLELHVHDEYRFADAKELYRYKFQQADKKILDRINEI